MKKIVIGVMGGGQGDKKTLDAAFRLGKLIAKEGWVLLNGGRPAGVMDASARGAKDGGGLTVGVSPGESRSGVSDWIDVPILTGMGMARNTINVLSSDIVIACPGGAGTLSEIALALKCGRKVILLGFDTGGVFDSWSEAGLLFQVGTPEEAVQTARRLIGRADQ